MEYKNWHRENKYYICKRLRMLEYLRDRGFLPVRTEPDIHRPKYNVWIYENTPDLANAIEDYLEQQANRNK